MQTMTRSLEEPDNGASSPHERRNDGEASAEAKPAQAAPTLEELPQEFVQFLVANGVPLEAFAGTPSAPTPRYIRVNPRGALAAVPSEQRPDFVSKALGGAAVERVEWLRRLPGDGDPAAAPAVAANSACHEPPLLWAEVYACDASTNLSRTEAYKQGQLYGVDAASVFSVLCSGVRPGDRVLDLCCAPGAKLSTIADAVFPGGEAVGVDVAEPRLAACRTVVNKYGITNVRLALGDGTSWDPSASSWFDIRPPPRGRGQRGRKRRLEAAAAAAAEEGAAAEEATQDSMSSRPFDVVLVDAECTHDASWRHLKKFGSQWGWETLGGRVPWVRQEESLYELQAALLANGFRLLREGGTLVYSTCSLCRSQNEDIVAAFLKKEPAACLDPLPLPLQGQSVREGMAGGDAHGPAAPVSPARPSLLEAAGPLGDGGRFCTARFDPLVSGTSGLFIARLRKRPRTAGTAAASEQAPGSGTAASGGARAAACATSQSVDDGPASAAKQSSIGLERPAEPSGPGGGS